MTAKRPPDRHANADMFASAEDAWFWAYGAWQARHQGSAANGEGARRPCDPDDILLSVERLLRSRRIDAAHAAVLGRWGQRQVAPSDHWGQAQEITLWQDAMTALGAILSHKGLLASHKLASHKLASHK
jgi:hypothetical protein